MKLSIIIPLAPDETTWQTLLPQLVFFTEETEILLVTSSQNTNRPLPLGEGGGEGKITLIFSENGRAQSMNKGAEHAQGEYLWFLHADTQLQNNTPQIINAIINKPHLKDSLWFFDLRFLDDGPPNMAINTLGVFIRSHLFKLPFGDQAFLLKKSLFEQIGKYNEQLSYGEDHLLVWQAHHHGISVKPIGASIKTSARKYKIKGRWPTTKKHLQLTYTQAWIELKILLKTKFI